MRKFTQDDVQILNNLKKFMVAPEIYLPDAEKASETSYLQVTSDLIEGFRYFCGSSAGARTACWSFAEVIYVEYLAEQDSRFQDIIFYDAVREINNNYDDYDNSYDIMLISGDEILEISEQIIDWIPDELVSSYIYGLFAFAGRPDYTIS